MKKLLNSVKTVVFQLVFFLCLPSMGKWEIISPTIPIVQYNDVYWTGTKAIAVGEYGKMVSSVDGINWTAINSRTSFSLYAITGNGKTLVAVGDVGTIISSSDGETWTQRYYDRFYNLRDIIWADTQFVAVGSLNYIMTSPDGIIWTQQVGNDYAGDLNSVAWNGKRLIASDALTWFKSTDGIDWKYANIYDNTTYNKIIWENNTWIVLGETMLNIDSIIFPAIVVTSNDTTWKMHSAGFRGRLYDICWTGTNYVALGQKTDSVPVGIVATSHDALNWTIQKSEIPAGLTAITWAGSYLIAVGCNGCLIKSTDNGATWIFSSQMKQNSLTDITWTGSIFVATGEHGTILTSLNGRIWTSQKSNTNINLRSITSNNDKLVAVGDSGTVTFSSDGVKWTTSRISKLNLSSVAWGGKAGTEKFVACGGDNYIPEETKYPLYYSYDGISWDSSFARIGYAPNTIAADNKMFIICSETSHCTSEDGIAWDCISTTDNYNSVCKIDYTYYCITNGSIKKSIDGLFFDDFSTLVRTSPDNFYQYKNITYSNNTFVISGCKSNHEYIESKHATIATSVDAKSWKFEDIDSVPEVVAVTFGKGMWVAVGDNNTILVNETQTVNTINSNILLKNSDNHTLFEFIITRLKFKYIASL